MAILSYDYPSPPGHFPSFHIGRSANDGFDLVFKEEDYEKDDITITEIELRDASAKQLWTEEQLEAINLYRAFLNEQEKGFVKS